MRVLFLWYTKERFFLLAALQAYFSVTARFGRDLVQLLFMSIFVSNASYFRLISWF